jgi:hypothetical protein
MESTEKTVGDVNGSFRKCGYPYCRNMAIATKDYCELHRHSTLLVKHPKSKNPTKKTIKIAAKVMAKALTTPLPAEEAAVKKKTMFIVSVEATQKTFDYYIDAQVFVKDLMLIHLCGIRFDKIVKVV